PASAKEVANAIPALTDARQRPMEIISKPQRDLVSTPQKAEPASPSSVRKRRPERLLESNMTKELTGRASTAKSEDRSMDLSMVKRRDVTEYTLVGDPGEFMPQFGTTDRDFF